MGIIDFFGSEPPPNPYTRKDFARDVDPARINSAVYVEKLSYGNKKSKSTPLRCAFYYGDASIVRDLIKNGADISEFEGNPWQVYDKKLFDIFVKAGLNTKSLELSKFVEQDNVEYIKIILNNGADVNADIGGQTPVQAAAARGDSKVLKFLIDSGGKVDVRDDLGTVPLYEAIIGNKLAFAPIGTPGPRLTNIQVLINAGADVNAVCHGETLLEFAIRLGNEKVIKMLKDAGAK
jgi:ankyrin repeat protein